MRRIAPALPSRDGVRRLVRDVALAPIVIVAFSACALSMLAATLAIRLHQMGHAAGAVGFNAAAAGLAALVVAPIVPSLAARLGTARMLGAALALAALALAGFLVFSSFASWLVLRAVEGGCATVLFVLGEYWITARAPENWRGAVIGCYVAAVAASFTLGPLLLAVLTPRGNGPFLLGIVLCAAAAAVLALAGGSAPPVRQRSRASLLSFYVAAPALMFAATLHGAIETAGLNLLPVVAAGPGAAIARGALDTSLFILGAGALQLPVGIVAGRLGRARMLVVLAFAAAIGAVILATIGTERPVAFAIGLLLWGGIVGSFYPIGLGELPRRFGGDGALGANSTFVLAYGIGTLVGPPLAGAAADLAPGIGFFAMLAAFNIAYLAIGLAGRRAG